MAGWRKHQGQVVHLPLENIDTDQLIPARFMSVPRSAGYGPYLMHDLRRDGQGALQEGFALNAQVDASVLIAGRNFGSGSSREAAVYALVDAGFRAVFAPSFGDIFAGNAVNNGLLPAVTSKDDLAALAQAVGPATIDLETVSVTRGEITVAFALEDSWREKLINGWDDIDLTLNEGAAIARFRAGRVAKRWAWPATD